MRVPCFDLTAQYAALGDEIMAALDRVCHQVSSYSAKRSRSSQTNRLRREKLAQIVGEK
jgi:hypothetical protein